MTDNIKAVVAKGQDYIALKSVKLKDDKVSDSVSKLCQDILNDMQQKIEEEQHG